jgi:hypothetical protein
MKTSSSTVVVMKVCIIIMSMRKYSIHTELNSPTSILHALERAWHMDGKVGFVGSTHALHSFE